MLLVVRNSTIIYSNCMDIGQSSISEQTFKKKCVLPLKPVVKDVFLFIFFILNNQHTGNTLSGRFRPEINLLVLFLIFIFYHTETLMMVRGASGIKLCNVASVKSHHHHL